MGQTPGPVGPPPLFPLPRKGGLGKHPPPVGGTLFAKRAFGKLPFVHLIFVLFLNTTTNRRKTTPSLVLAVLRATPPRRGIAHISGVLSFPSAEGCPQGGVVFALCSSCSLLCFAKKKAVVGRNARPCGNTQFVPKIYVFSNMAQGRGFPARAPNATQRNINVFTRAGIPRPYVVLRVFRRFALVSCCYAVALCAFLSYKLYLYCLIFCELSLLFFLKFALMGLCSRPTIYYNLS